MTGICLRDATVVTKATKQREAFNLLATGEIPDIVGGGAARDFVKRYGPKGAFLPQGDLMAERAPNITAFFDEHPDLLEAITAADGNICYIPYLPDGEFGRGTFIRQDWLDALGLEQPQTVEEVKAVLEAFRDDDPNGNGRKDEIPCFNRDREKMVRLVTLWDGRTSGSDTSHDVMATDGGKVVRPDAREGYRDGIADLAEWYAEGLIDPEIFTCGAASRDDLLSENPGGMTHDGFASTSGYRTALADQVEGLNLVAFPPPASTGGVRLEEHRRIPVKPDGWPIGATNAHPVETMKSFDFWFTPEGSAPANFGVEGQADLYRGCAGLGPRGQQPDGRDRGPDVPGLSAGPRRRAAGNQPAQDGIALHESGDDITDQFPGGAFTPEEQSVYDRYRPSLRPYMLERQQAWILGTGDVREGWDGYLETLDEMGYSQVIELMNAAYARHYD